MKALVSTKKLNPKYRGGLKLIKPKQNNKKYMETKEKKNREIKTTSGNATQNTATSIVGGDEGGGAARGVYCLGHGEHTLALEIHTQAHGVYALEHAVLAADRRVAKES